MTTTNKLFSFGEKNSKEEGEGYSTKKNKTQHLVPGAQQHSPA